MSAELFPYAMGIGHTLGMRKPPSQFVLNGCGCLASAALLGAIAEFAYVIYKLPETFAAPNLQKAAISGTVIVLLASALLGIGALEAWVVISGMKQLHRELTPREVWSNARGSTYRSLPIEHAFRSIGFCLTLGMLAAFYFKPSYLGTILLVWALAVLGMLIWQHEWENLRFEQVQAARDQLATSFFDELNRLARNEENVDEDSFLLDSRKSFLYLRPFAATDRVKAVTWDSLTSGALDLEVRLTDALSQWGPVVTLGRPGEVKGAGRSEVAEKDWKPVIALAFETVDSIFLVPGYREGIVWEMKLLVKKKLLDRVVFIRPPKTRHLDDEWWEKTRQAMQAEGLASPAAMDRDRGALFVLGPEGEMCTMVEFRRSAGIKQLQRVLRELLQNIEKQNRELQE